VELVWPKGSDLASWLSLATLPQLQSFSFIDCLDVRFTVPPAGLLNLTSLRFDGSGFFGSEEDESRFMRSISRMPHLADLCLHSQNTAAGVGALADALPTLAAPTALTLRAAPWATTCAPAIAALASCSRLQRLTLESHVAAQAWVTALAAAIRGCSRLETLDLRYVTRAVGDESSTPLQPALVALAACTRLRDVAFYNVCLGEGGAQLLCSQLAQHPALRKLSIQNCGVAASEVAALQALVSFVKV